MMLGAQATFHPFDYAKTLIRLGYEPIAPYPGRTLYGMQVLKLPNIFQYSKMIRIGH